MFLEDDTPNKTINLQNYYVYYFCVEVSILVFLCLIEILIGERGAHNSKGFIWSPIDYWYD